MSEEKRLKDAIKQAERHLVVARRNEERVRAEYRDLTVARRQEGAPNSIGISEQQLREKRQDFQTCQVSTENIEATIENLRRQLAELPQRLNKKRSTSRNGKRSTSRNGKRSTSRNRNGKRSTSRSRSRGRAAESPRLPNSLEERLALVNGNRVGRDLVTDLESAEASLDQARHDDEPLGPYRQHLERVKTALRNHMSARRRS